MKNFLDRAGLTARAIFVALFALVQIVPQGFALAAGADGVEFVVCTANGSTTVSWEDLTGEPSPFDQPSGHKKPDCAACHTTCRIGAAVPPCLQLYSFTAPLYSAAEFPDAAGAPMVRKTLPPMPSRAPPYSLKLTA
ncbi:MAG: hypothetical protein KDD85_13405 [Parvularculaceae bacterium]|nr:hypothetical protein [Parvularculaceae bacterium]